MTTKASYKTYFTIDQNPWWLKDFSPTSLPEHGQTPRFVLEKLKNVFYGTDLIIVVKGLRRLGKTTVIKHLILDALEKGVYKGEDIYFVELTQLENNLALVLKNVPKKALLIVDEIQYCKRWKDLLKKSYDTYPQKRIIATGSSGLNLGNLSKLDKSKRGEPLVGRFMPILLKPLTFLEFLTLKHGPDFHPRLVSYTEWEEYILYGEFPKTLHMQDPEAKFDYLKKSVLEAILSRDIVLYDIDKRAEFSNFYTVLASNMCQQVKKLNFASEVGLSRQTLTKYLDTLVDLGLIQLLPNYYKSLRKSSLSLKKPIFLSTNLALVALNVRTLSSLALKDFYGHVFENAVISNIMLLKGDDARYCYWRHMQKELDLISDCGGDIVAWEVKSNQQVGPGALEMYKRYATAVGAKDFLLVDKDNFLDMLTKPTPLY